ncbi:MAG: hypothetical protein K8R31_03950 [Bacteroidales bacterium]|nr:hypothetical protein [Bacteroidales bacterium]
MEIFDDRIEIGNPGGLPKGLSSDTFGKKAVRRNPIITNLLQRCKFVENVGTGINKIRQLCFENNIPEPEFTFNDFFTVIFKRHTLNDGINEGVNEGVNNLLEIIKTYPGNRTPFFAEKLSTSVKNIERWIHILKKANQIEFTGSSKKGGYNVK